MTLSRPCALFVLALAAAAAASCGGSSSDSTTTTGPKPAIQLAATASGDGQTATVQTALASALRVLVTLSGSPVPGDTVRWATSAAGGSVNPTQSVTDASGIATTTWTLGQTAGPQDATATLGGATGSPVSFSATATAGAAASLAKGTGDSASSGPNTSLVIHVRAADTFGNSVAGIPVTWNVSSGPATVSPAVDTTGVAGAQTTVQIGATTGPIVITATSAGLTGSPITFHETSAPFATTATVQIGDDFFKSAANGSTPAVDTIAAGGTVTWNWTGTVNHSVQSTGSPSFTSSTIKSSGSYSFTFAVAGTYTYDCAVHGTAMSGTVVVK